MAPATTRKTALTSKRKSKRARLIAKRLSIWRRTLLWAGLVAPCLLFAAYYIIRYIPGYAMVHGFLFWAAEQPWLRGTIGLQGLWGELVARLLLTIIQYTALSLIVLSLIEGERLLRRETDIPV